MNKKFITYIALAAILSVGGAVTSCQDKEYESLPAEMQALTFGASDVKCELQGDDYVITWPELAEGLKMQVTRYDGKAIASVDVVEGTKYVHSRVETNKDFTYILKATKKIEVDKEEKDLLSNGVTLYYTRKGAESIEGLKMKQIDTGSSYNMQINWDAPKDANSVKLVATCGNKKVEKDFSKDVTEYTIEDVKFEEVWNVSLIAINEVGPALSTIGSLRIGTTIIGYLSEYATPEELIANGDDDEAAAWLWTKANYPKAEYVYFGNIKSAADLKAYRVLFWLRDLETDRFDDVMAFSETVKAATPHVSQWYKDGGSLLLWSHACPYIEQVGRLPIGTFTEAGTDAAFGTGKGWNDGGADWVLAVSAYPGEKFKLNYFEHPLYEGIERESRDGDTWEAIHMLGPGWREDHNCLFHNLPGKLTGKGNQDKACYDECTANFGIYPLGTWDGQRAWIGQLNVWEAQGYKDCKGTVICIGNGGCEFSQNYPDGSKNIDVINNPINIYQDNINRMAKNALEYLKTR